MTVTPVAAATGWAVPCAFCEQMNCVCANPRPVRPYNASTSNRRRNNPVAVDFHAVVGGMENALRTIAIDPAFEMPARTQLLQDLLAIVPQAERGLLIDRFLQLGTAYRRSWELDNEARATALHNELAGVAEQTAQLVVRESAAAVAKYAALALSGAA